MSEVDPRIVRSRIRIIQRQPFFGFLVMHLIPKKVAEDEPGMLGPAAVDIKGNLFYKESLLDELSESELEAVICHEIMHLALQHPTRREERDPNLFNVAGDLIINEILENEGFRLPDWVLRMKGEYAKYKGSFTEEIYEGLKKDHPESQGCQMIIYVDGGEGEGGEGKDGDGKGGKGVKIVGMSPELAKKLGGVGYKPGDKEINWKRVLVEATTHAKMMGKLPGGIEGLVDAELEPPKFHWKELLWQYISRCVPQDFTYSRPSKKSRAAGFFMPSVTREHIDITVWFDTSGSISDDEYITFISELYMIARSFESINLTVGLCDAKVQSVLNGQGPFQIIEEVRSRKGYGGTDFRPGLDWTIENKPAARLVIYFTDGYPNTWDIDPPPFNVLWVFTENSADPSDAPFGQVIKMED